MQPQLKNMLLAALCVLPNAFAQTSSDCDPTDTTKQCIPKNPGLTETFTHDFSTSGKSDQFEYLGSMQNIKYDSNGINMPCINPKDSPSIGSLFYIFWGKVDIVMKAAPGAGIISSLVLQSSTRDEIDLEFVGVQDTQVQTNIFRKGNRDISDPGNSTVAQPQTQWHTYTIDWKSDSLTYLIDGQVARVIERSTNPDLYPQTPMNIRIGSWTAGDKNQPEGTIEWSQGPIDYSKGPFDMMVKSITVENYTPAAEYTYQGSTGSSDSVQVIKNAVDTSSTSTSTVAASTTTTSASSTSTSTKDVETTTSAKSTATETTDAITSTVAKSTVTSTGSNTSTSTVAKTTTTDSTTLKTSATGSQTTGSTTTSASTSASASASASAKPSSSASVKSVSVVISSVVALMAAVFVL